MHTKKRIAIVLCFTANCCRTYYLGEKPQATDKAVLIHAKQN